MFRSIFEEMVLLTKSLESSDLAKLAKQHAVEYAVATMAGNSAEAERHRKLHQEYKAKIIAK